MGTAAGPFETKSTPNIIKQYKTSLHKPVVPLEKRAMPSVVLNVPGTSGTQGAPATASASPGFLGLLDALLRKREGFFEEIFAGRELGHRMRWFLLSIALLTGLYGATMGAMGLTENAWRGLLQMSASAIKVPALYLLSVAICFPVLYIVLVLMGARLSFSQTLSLILLAITLNSVLLASCAPILMFFMITSSDYHFIKLLHVAVFAFSGCWAMGALWQGLRTMCEKSDLYPKQAIKILQVWVIIFGFVGTQMAWSLRPFVGEPSLGFELFRNEREGNFYKAVWISMKDLAKSAVD